MLVKRVNLNFKEAEGKKFFYTDLGSETHGRPSFRLWVSERLVQTKDSHYFLEFPVLNAGITRTEKGTLVLRPTQDTVTYNVLIPCGYRGDSYLEVVSPETAQVYLYKEYSSPRGNLGVSRGAIIVAPLAPLGSIKFKWERTGRLYGSAPTGITKLYPDGREETIDRVEDIEDLKELSQLLE